MELIEAMRTTGTCRRFKPGAGARRSALPGLRGRALRAAGRQPPASELGHRARPGERGGSSVSGTCPLWHEYLRHNGASGRAGTRCRRGCRSQTASPAASATHPAIVVACAQLDALYVTDADLGPPEHRRRRLDLPDCAEPLPRAARRRDRQRAHDDARAARAGGQGAARHPGRARDRLPLVVGYPERPFPTRLKRAPVEEFVFVDEYSRRFRRRRATDDVQPRARPPPHRGAIAAACG